MDNKNMRLLLKIQQLLLMLINIETIALLDEGAAQQNVWKYEIT